MPASRILIARIGAAHGIRGEVVVTSYAADPQALVRYGVLTDGEAKRNVTITKIREAGKGLIATLAGVTDRTAAEALKGAELFVARDRLPAPNADEFYLADLIGLAVHAPDGRRIGTVVDMPNYGAGDLIEIETAPGVETTVLAFSRETVPNIDIGAGRLTAVLPTPESSDAGEEE